MRLSSAVLGVVCSLFLMSCGDDSVPPSTPLPSTPLPSPTPAPQTERDRQINNTQAASAVGYDGDAVKRSVQKVVTTLENHNAETQAAADSAAQAAPEITK